MRHPGTANHPWGLRTAAEAIAALPAPGPLPFRTVLLPRLRMGHALKRELIAANAAGALAGTSFATALVAAREVLALAGQATAEAEEAVRPIKVAGLLATLPGLRHFTASLVERPLGWEAALASTLNELEAAGVTPAQLRAVGDARCNDLALLQEGLAADATAALTFSGLLRRAAAILAAGGRWPYPGAALALVTGHETGAEAEFLSQVPGLRRHLLPARPQRPSWRSHVAALHGEPAASSLDLPASPAPATTELQLLQAWLFADPEALSAPSRQRSLGADGTVDFEEHAGVESELEATADWLVRQVRAGVNLGGLAVLVPRADPLVSMVRSRLERLPWPGGPLPVFVAGGEPLTATASGTRLLALLRALGAYLSAQTLTALLPSLALQGEGRRHLGREEAVELVQSSGTLGGAPSNPQGALAWLPAARRLASALDRRIEETEAALEKDDDDTSQRMLTSLRRQREDLVRLDPALAALDALARLVVDGAPLTELWPPLARFVLDEQHLLLPPEPAGLGPALREAVEALCRQPGTGSVRGLDALTLVETTGEGLRHAVGRFGTPAVYVGTVRGAVGLGFDAVRIIGLAEGTIPPSVREDAILGTELRERLAAPALATRETRALRELHALHRVVLETRRHLTLSYPRADLEGSVHEASSVFIEAMAALGRPSATTGQPAPLVPTSSEVARDGFVPARVAQRASRLDRPVGDGAWLDRVARLKSDVPAFWASAEAMDPFAIQRLLEADRSGLDGYLGEASAELPMRGLTEALPISASRLGALLSCPHRFLLEHVIGWSEPAGEQPIGTLAPQTFGTLVHRILERFARSHGPSLSGKTLEAWRKGLHQLAEEELALTLEGYALLGPGVREAERRRLLRNVDLFLDAEWEARKRRVFIDAERAFGEGRGLPLRLPEGELFVRGYIDRLDREGGATLVRDYKTGRARPRRGQEQAPDPSLDVQVALYGLVTRQQAKAWKVPAKVAMAYAYPNASTPLRDFIDDAEELLELGQSWLSLARELLTRRFFPRAPDTDACRYCAFSVVCGGDGPTRSAGFLQAPRPDEEALALIWGDVMGADDADAEAAS